jgi:hypothetical protein
MSQFKLEFIYTWKCHKETPCIAILNNEKYHFLKTQLENRRVEQVLPRGVGTSGRGEDVGRVCKHCVHRYVNGKMRSVETHPGGG